MDLEELGAEIRRARVARGLTQAQLASAAHITRTTVNQLENGVLRDLGLRKVKSLLDQVGLVLQVADASVLVKEPDFLHQASVSASVSFKEPLTERELSRALATGKIPPGRRPHLRRLLEETPRPLLEGLIRQVSGWARPGRVQRNLDRITAAVGLGDDTEKPWTIA